MPTTIRLFNQKQVFKRVILEYTNHHNTISDYILYDNVMYSRWSGRSNLMEYKQVSAAEQYTLYANWIANTLRLPESSTNIRSEIYKQSKELADKFLSSFDVIEVMYDKREESEASNEVQHCPTDH